MSARWLALAAFGLLCGVAEGAPQAPKALERFQCFTKGSENLAEPGGGPSGSHWNPQDVRCEVVLGAAVDRDARLDLRYGQVGRLALVGRRYTPSSRGGDPLGTAPSEAAAPVQTFHVPQRVVEAAFTRPARDPATGATVYPVRFELDVTGPDGARLAAARLDLRCATGE